MKNFHSNKRILFLPTSTGQHPKPGSRLSGGKLRLTLRLTLLLILPMQLFLSACSISVLNGYRHGNEADLITPVSWFRTDSSHLLLRTTIDVMKRHFSGLMVIKSLPNTGYRVVFITEVGLKIFDLEFSPDQPVKVHYFMDALNKKALVNTLSRDIGLALMTNRNIEKPVVLLDRSSGRLVLKYKDRKLSDYYEISSGSGKAVSALQTSCVAKKTRVDYYSGNGMTIDSVKIAHYHVNLEIQMIRITENTDHAAE